MIVLKLGAHLPHTPVNVFEDMCPLSDTSLFVVKTQRYGGWATLVGDDNDRHESLL